MTLSATGFTRQRLAEIKVDLDARITEALGPVATGADSVVGQINGVMSDVLDDVWQAVQDTYDSMYPATAEGAALDGAVSFIGLQRLPAAATTVTAMLYGTESTPVPAGSTATAGGSVYVLDGDVTISRSNAGDAVISVASVENSSIYQIIAGGVSVTYTSDASATASEITAGLAALFDPELFIATASGSTLRLRYADQTTGFALTVSSRLSITSIGTPGSFTAVDMGANELPAGALNSIGSVTSGWTAVNNLVSGSIGRDVETDEQLRVRHAEGVEVTGTATVKAIRARTLAVDGVTYAAVYENRTNETVDGMPPHSFEVVVYGGSASEIVDTIWSSKPAGIETYGNSSQVIYDDNGDGQIIYYSRPESGYAWVRVTVNAYDPEETLDPEFIDEIKAAVLATGKAIDIGKDIITQRFYGPIYGATPGLADITVEIDVTATDAGPPVYSEDNIVIDRTAITEFSLDRISVVTP